VFFPACANAAPAAKEKSDTTAFFRGGDETILVVEDESVLRELAHAILEGCGYQIIEAASGREALEVWRQYDGRIDLVLTDMVMPEGVSGVELAKKLIALRPDVKIVFASGYTVDVVSTDFLARTNNARFIQKPYTHVVLTKTVRQALDGKSVQAPPDAAPVQ
ncbi:MAG TPA: response regulator, partial [Verrucomicrobiae bacterium]|nr:response regulator [Verrucomicrobiae bacterium]